MLPVKPTQELLNCGLFGTKRKYDTHTGIDIYCREGEQVLNLQEGKVVDVYQFTGEAVGSPWWNDTYAVVVSVGLLDIVYGEVIPLVQVGDILLVGDVLGISTPVLKTDKGITPTTMLHLEAWVAGKHDRDFIWESKETKHWGLLQPSVLFKQDKHWLLKTISGYRLETSNGDFVRLFSMAADCKSYCMGNSVEFTYLTEVSPLQERVLYSLTTNKETPFGKDW